MEEMRVRTTRLLPVAAGIALLALASGASPAAAEELDDSAAALTAIQAATTDFSSQIEQLAAGLQERVCASDTDCNGLGETCVRDGRCKVFNTICDGAQGVIDE